MDKIHKAQTIGGYVRQNVGNQSFDILRRLVNSGDNDTVVKVITGVSNEVTWDSNRNSKKKRDELDKIFRKVHLYYRDKKGPIVRDLKCLIKKVEPKAMIIGDL